MSQAVYPGEDTKPASALQLVWLAWPLFIGVGLLMVSNGLQGTLLGVRASLEGFPVMATGIIMSGYSIGFLIGSAVTRRLISNVGHVRTFAALASMASVATLVHGVQVDPITWTAMRILTGICYAGLYIVCESWLNNQSGNEIRGRILSYYMLMNYAGIAAGQGLISTADPGSIYLFVIASIAVSIALVPILLSTGPAPKIESSNEKLGLRAVYNCSPLGVIAVMAAGIGTGGFTSMGPVFADLSGLDLQEVSTFMVLSTIGGAVLQWPIGKISDLMDRRKVILFVSGAACLTAVLALILGEQKLFLMISSGMFGGLSYPLYSLAMSHSNDHLPAEKMVAGSAALIGIYGLGYVLGPISTSALMNIFGNMGYFGFLSVVYGGLAIFTIYRMTRRAAVPLKEQGPHIMQPARATALVQAVTEDIAEDWDTLIEENQENSSPEDKSE